MNKYKKRTTVGSVFIKFDQVEANYLFSNYCLSLNFIEIHFFWYHTSLSITIYAVNCFPYNFKFIIEKDYIFSQL